MSSLSGWSVDDKTVRTQITLMVGLKKLVEEQARKNKESLSEYLRQAAILSLALTRKKEEDLSLLAYRVIGSVELKNKPEWSSVNKVKDWSRRIRGEWEDE